MVRSVNVNERQRKTLRAVALVQLEKDSYQGTPFRRAMKAHPVLGFQPLGFAMVRLGG
jgi:hypothetical protein